MGLLSRGGSILAASVSREVNCRQPSTATAARVLLMWQSHKGRSIRRDGAVLQLDWRDVEQEPRHFVKERVLVREPSSGQVKVNHVGNRCLDGELHSGVGFRALSYGGESIQHIEDRIPGQVNNCRCSTFAIGLVKEMKCRGPDWDMEQTTGCAYGEIAEDPEVRLLALGEEITQDSIGSLAPGTDCGPNSLEIGIMKDVTLKTVRENAGQNAKYEGKGNMKCTERECWADEVNSTIPTGFLETRASSKESRGATSEETKNATFTTQIEEVQGNKLKGTNCAHQEVDSQYPVPLSPLSGELAKSIEYERAMVAETAMKCGPPMTRSGVLFEDEWLLVLNKPCGMYCEHVLATVPSLLTPTDVLQARGSSLSRLTLHRPVDNKDTDLPHLHMANRLDRDTSGVMVITKCRSAARKLSHIFAKRQVQKSYVALCRGPRPSWKSVTVDSGHGRSRYGAWRVYSKKDVGRGLPGGSVVRNMTTQLLVMAINKESVHDEQVVGCSSLDELKDTECVVTAGDESSRGILGQCPSETLKIDSNDSSHDSQASAETDEVVIRAIPCTGRTHQIRLHCQFVGLPLRGDVKYGGPHFLNEVRYDHHALHAESLSFMHPFTFEDVHFVAPLPVWATEAGVSPSSSDV